MKIGYRRWSAPIGLSADETCKISGWLEKRKALLRFLKSRGHEIVMLSKPTRHTAHMYNYEEHKKWLGKIDCLFLEMSNHNMFHNYETIKETVAILAATDCPVYVLWDDPDLKFHIWSNKFNEFYIKKDLITVFTNAEYIKGNEEYLKEQLYYKPHIEVKETVFEFFPIVGLLDYSVADSKAAAFPRKEELVYLGGCSGGRKNELLKLKEKVPLKIFYHDKNYDFPIDGDAPRQVDRLNFYAQYAANLGIQDKKHKKLGWLTGRIFHALMAGTPSLAEADSNLAKYCMAYTHDNVEEQFRYLSRNRMDCIVHGRAAMTGLKDAASLTLEKYGL